MVNGKWGNENVRHGDGPEVFASLGLRRAQLCGPRQWLRGHARPPENHPRSPENHPRRSRDVPSSVEEGSSAAGAIAGAGGGLLPLAARGSPPNLGGARSASDGGAYRQPQRGVVTGSLSKPQSLARGKPHERKLFTSFCGWLPRPRGTLPEALIRPSG